MTAARHTSEYHGNAIADPAIWSTWRFDGVQVLAGDEEFDEERYECRTCPCGASFSKFIPPARWAEFQ